MGFDYIFKTLTKVKDPDSSVHKAGDIKLGSIVPYGIPTGIPRLDLSLGRPGLPAGRVVEYYGFEGSGKTTAALHALAQAQRLGGGGLFIDAEYSWDEERAQDIGVDVNQHLAISEVNTIEGIFRQLEAAIVGLIESGFNRPFIIIVDSITGVTTEHEREKTFGEEARVGQDARVIRQGMRKIMQDIAKSKACVIFVNHAISKIAAMAYAKQSQSSGGHAIKFFSTVRCEFQNAGMIKNEDDKTRRLGQKVNITIEKLKKSRLEIPLIKEVHLLNDTGFDLTTELLLGAIQSGLVKHPPGSRSYTIGEREFSREDWPAVVSDLGGPDNLYTSFLKWSKDNGVIRPWDLENYE